MIRKRVAVAVLGAALVAFAPAAHAQGDDGAAAPPDPALAAKGKQLFTAKGCPACHTIGEGTRVGPDLKDVTTRRTLAWLRRFVSKPSAMLQSDSAAKALYDQYHVPMPDLGLKQEEVEALVAYLRQVAPSGGP